MAQINLKTTNNVKHFERTPEIQQRFSPEEKTKLQKASKDFESLLTSMMIKSMTKSTNGLFGEESYGGDVFNTIFEGEISSYISDSKSLGVADVIYKKLTGENIGTQPSVKSIGERLHEIKPEAKRDKTKIDETIIKEGLRPSSQSLKRLKQFEPIVEAAAQKFNIDKNLIKSVILTESAANEKAVSSAKAKGLMQLMDSTASDMGVKDVFDPKENIFGGAKYLAKMVRKYNGDTKLALAAYNAGPGNVQKHNGVPPFKETQNYIARVFSYLNHLKG